MKSKFKFIYIFLFAVFFWIWKDFKKIDITFVNQNFITYDYYNLNSQILRNLYNYYNLTLENILVGNFDLHKNYWTEENKNQRLFLPEYNILKNNKKFTKNENLNEQNLLNWQRSHGNNFSNRFSNLQQINNFNAKNLEVAWIYEEKEKKGSIQANPIIIDGIVYTPIAGGYIVAIDGSNGSLIWKSKRFGSDVAKRGLVFWEGNQKEGPRIIFTNRQRIVSLNAKNGEVIATFGKNGETRSGLTVITPIIYKQNIVIASWDRSIEVYDLISGKIRWKLKYKKDNNERYGGVKFNNLGGHPWGGISADIERGLLYITTGNPHSYFDGTKRPGSNRYTNSVIAIDLNQKKILWDFQETSHDIWNLDLPAPPILTSIKIKNDLIDVVVTPTKKSNTLVLDRLTGQPIFEYRLKKAPISNLPGEKTSSYQPDLEIPEPFGKNVFSLSDLWSYDPLKLKKHKEKYKNYKFGFYETYELNKKTIQYNFNGGAEWMGASIDHENNLMYVTSNNIPWETGINKIENNNSLIPLYSSFFKRALDDKGFPVTNPPWGSLTALNLNTGKIKWQVPFGEYDDLKKLGFDRTGTENFGGVTGTSGNILIATGTLDKKLYIFDSNNGQILYSKILPFIGSAPPSTYMVNNEQHIVLHASGGITLQQGYPELVETGNILIAFKLKK